MSATAGLVPRNGPIYLHINMVARLLGETPYVVHGLIETGQLPSVKVDGRNYIDVNKVADYRDRRARGEQRVPDGKTGKVLALWRTTCGMSLREVAEEAGVDRGLLARVERGEALPTEAWVWRVSRALGSMVADRGTAVAS